MYRCPILQPTLQDGLPFLPPAVVTARSTWLAISRPASVTRFNTVESSPVAPCVPWSRKN